MRKCFKNLPFFLLGDDLHNKDYNTDEKHGGPEGAGVQQPAQQHLHRHELHEQPSYEHPPQQSNYEHSPEHNEQWGHEHKPTHEHSRNEHNKDENRSSSYEQNNSDYEHRNSDHEQRYRDDEHLQSKHEHGMNTNSYEDRSVFQHHERNVFV